MKIRCCSLSMPVVLASEVVGDGGAVAVVVLDVRVQAAATTLITTRASAARRSNMAAESIGGGSEQRTRRARRPPQRFQEQGRTRLLHEVERVPQIAGLRLAPRRPGVRPPVGRGVEPLSVQE